MKVATDVEHVLRPDPLSSATCNRLPWWQRLRGEQLVAAGVAIVLNVAAVWLLARHEGTQLPVPVGNDHVIELVFLKREPEPVATRPTDDAPARPAATPAIRSRPRTSPAQASKPDAFEPLRPAGSAIAETTSRHQLDLSIGEAAISFEPAPLARKQAALVSEALIRLPLVFTERSFGGAMRRHGRRMLCHELRSALRTSPGSASGILAAMQEQGCKL